MWVENVKVSLDDVGSATVYGEPYLFKIDLSGRVVQDQFHLGEGNPKLFGVYEMTCTSFCALKSVAPGDL